MILQGFTYHTLPMERDYEGEVVATLISDKRNKPERPTVLYLHGFIDHFFHPHLSQCFQDHGYNFHALELRKYGNSLLPHQHPNYCRDLREYFGEITIAIRKLQQEQPSELLLLGHSTGALIACLYAKEGSNRSDINALILNSPFLEFDIPEFIRTMTLPLFRSIGKLFPYACLPNVLSSLYVESLHKNYRGEWGFNLDWKPLYGFPTYFPWLVAISEAHQKIQKDLDLKLPILLLHSQRSLKPGRRWNEELRYGDAVLNVEDMKHYGSKLGNNVQLQEVEGALHDIFLSVPTVRQQAMARMMEWVLGMKVS